MIQLRTKAPKITPAIIDLLATSLNAGKVLVLPTDTIYGLSCLATNSKAIRRVYKLKKRDPHKPLIILVSSIAMLKKYVFISPPQNLFLKRVWNSELQPTTVILRHRNILAPELTKDSSGLAARLPKNRFLIKILKKVNCPLVSTSLNLSGRANIYDLSSLSRHFINTTEMPDLVVDFGKCSNSKPSRLIDLRDCKHPVILRK